MNQTSSSATPDASSPPASCSGGLELVKWAAFAAMLADHVDLILLGRSVPELHAIGRFALPAFAVAFGIGLARTSDLLHVACRLVAPAFLAAFAWAAVHPLPYVNVLVTFFLGAMIVAAFQYHAAAGLLIGLLTWLAGPDLEGGSPAVFLVVGAWAAVTWRSPWPALATAAPWLAFALSPGVVLGLLAPWAARYASIRLPRHPGLLLWAYPAHIAALGAVRALA